MRDEQGFTITEMVAALLVLSLGLASFGSLTNILLKSWSNIENAQTDLMAQTTLFEQIQTTEAIVKSSKQSVTAPALKPDDGRDLIIAKPKLDRAKTCEFDLVGRRCR